MQVLLPMRDVDWLDGIGKRAPIVISRVPHTPESILIIRDPFRGKLRSCYQSFKRGKSLRRPCKSVRSCPGSTLGQNRYSRQIGAADELTSRAILPRSHG